jgi:hypothetical protein
MEELYNYLFWYNHHDGLWYAIWRDTQIDFFSGNRENSKYYKSKDHSTLVEILVKPGILKKFRESD